MKPVSVSVEVPNSRDEVFDFLDVLSNHESFVDVMLTDFEYSGASSGVGARAKARTNAPMNQDRTTIEIVEAERPERIVEESLSANGKRRTRGTYALEELPGGGTRISFELVFTKMPWNERMIAPLIRRWMKRANGKAMRRLAKRLAEG
jgi:hypothetical protein